LDNVYVSRLVIDGIPCVKITIGVAADPASVRRTYDDIDRIFKADPDKFDVYQGVTAEGKFKEFIVSTSPLTIS
jgi:hypothetical protein